MIRRLRRLAQFSRLFPRLRSRLEYPDCDKYVNETYWQQRGRKYLEEFAEHGEGTKVAFAKQESVFLDVVKTLEFKSVLELGCGFGRMLKLLDDNFRLHQIWGIDVSEHQLGNATRLLNLADKSYIFLQQGNISELDWIPEHSFDLAYTSEVLMHVSDPEGILRSMQRITRKYILILEWQDLTLPFGVSLVAPWCFNHNYRQLCEKVGLVILDAKSVVEKQIMIVAQATSRNNGSPLT